MPSKMYDIRIRKLPGFPCLSCCLRSQASPPHSADNAAFDLTGPKIEMNVTRAEKTLPISEVPNLQWETASGFIPTYPTINRCTIC